MMRRPTWPLVPAFLLLAATAVAIAQAPTDATRRSARQPVRRAAPVRAPAPPPDFNHRALQGRGFYGRDCPERRNPRTVADWTKPLQFILIPSAGPGAPVLLVGGEFVEGDADRLRAFLATAGPVGEVQLDSGGGDAAEGPKVGRVIRAAGLSTRVGTGWVGSAVVDDLLDAGHSVTGLARSAEKAAVLRDKGVEVSIGTLDDLKLLSSAADAADAVIHAAFSHDDPDFAKSSEQERQAMEALGEALAGKDRPFLYSAGLALLTPGRVVTERDEGRRFDPAFPRKNEVAAAALAERGVRVAGVRLATTVHGTGDRMFMASLAELARRTGVSAYIGDGSNRWPAVHVSDAARLYRLALEAGTPGRYFHACAEEGIRFREIAEAIGRALNVPVEPRSEDHFGWLAVFVRADGPASSILTREATGWAPRGPALLADLADPAYFTR